MDEEDEADYDFFFQAEDGIRDLVRSRGLGDVYKRQLQWLTIGLPQLLAIARKKPASAGSMSSGRFGKCLSLIHI